MNRMTWPMAFALVFGAVPFAVFMVAVCAVYPFVGVPIVAGAVVAHGAYVRYRRDAALIDRAAVDYPRAAALVAAPLPDMPTVPNRLRR